MSMLMLLGIILALLAILAVCLPNRIVDTSSCKKNWCFIALILIGATLFIGQTRVSLHIATILFIGIFINYAIPFILNILTEFNRKTDP